MKLATLLILLPLLVATQVAFDGRALQQGENRQPADIEVCRKDFSTPTEEFEGATVVEVSTPVVVPTETIVEATETDVTLPRGMAVYFDFDRADFLPPTRQETLEDVMLPIKVILRLLKYINNVI